MKILTLALALFMSGFAEDVKAQSATVVTYQGKVLINKQMISSGLVPLGAEIDTSAENSRLIIRTPDGRILRFSEGVAKYKNPSLVEVIKGKFFAFIKNVPKERKDFKVRTRTAVMGVRGTKFLVLEEEKQSYLCVCEGVVDATKHDQPDNAVSVSAGFDLSIQNDNKPLGAPTKAPKMMWQIALEGFKEMGVPVTVPVEAPEAK